MPRTWKRPEASTSKGSLAEAQEPWTCIAPWALITPAVVWVCLGWAPQQGVPGLLSKALLLLLTEARLAKARLVEARLVWCWCTHTTHSARDSAREGVEASVAGHAAARHTTWASKHAAGTSGHSCGWEAAGAAEAYAEFAWAGESSQ